MSWARLDDKAYAHPKFLGLDPAAIALYWLGLSYAANIESDGFIPRAQVPILAAVFKAHRRAIKLADMLVERGLWDEKGPIGFEIPSLGSGWWVHDYLIYNPKRERDPSATRARPERDASASRARHENETTNTIFQTFNTECNTAPDPTRPDLKKKKLIAVGFDEFWIAYPKHVSKASAIKAWVKLNPNEDLRKRILAALTIQKKSKQWNKNGGEFIPYPASWINGKKWEDDLDVAILPGVALPQPGRGLITRETIAASMERMRKAKQE